LTSTEVGTAQGLDAARERVDESGPSSPVGEPAGTGVGVPGVRRDVRPYDFRQPEGLERGQLRGLRSVLDVYVRLAGGSLTSSLRTPVHMRVTDVRHSSWEGFAAAVENPAHLLVIELPPMPGRGIFYMPLAYAMAMLDVRMSGPGTGRFPKRPLTEIEDALLMPLMEASIGVMSTAFAPYVELSPRILQRAPDVDLLQAVIPSGFAVVIEFEVRLGEGGVFKPLLCLQLSTVRPIAEAIERTELLLGGERHSGPSPTLLERLLDVPVDLAVVFDPVRLTTSEVAALKVGDVIPLRHQPGRPLKLLAGGMPLFSVLPTTERRRLAAIVVEPDTYIPEEDDA
jgi:flagellar motor switch protein FliM